MKPWEIRLACLLVLPLAQRLQNLRRWAVVCLGLLIVSLAVTPAAAVNFTFTKIPNYGTASVGAVGGKYSLNNSGQVAFIATFPAQYDQLFLYSNGAVTQITNTPTLGNYAPCINDNGKITWYADGGISYNLYFYKGSGSPTLIANYYRSMSYDFKPHVDKNGRVVFMGSPSGNGGVIDIYSYNGTTQQVTNFSQSVGFSGVSHQIYGPQGNDTGMTAWYGSDYPNNQINQIYRSVPGSASYNMVSNNLNSYERIKINNQGQIIAIRDTYGNSFNNSLMLYDNSSFKVLYQDSPTSATLDIDSGQINNNGQVVWCAHDGQHYQIYLYSGGTTKKLTNNALDSSSPQINDAGQVVWATSGSGSMGLTSDIYFYNGTTSVLVQNPDNTQINVEPRINNQGQILFLGYGGSGNSERLYLATPNFTSPVANFTANPLKGLIPLLVKFTDTSTGTISTWAWDFGDGGTSAIQSPSYTYKKPGKYTAKLTVTGPGGTNNKTAIITVGSKGAGFLVPLILR
jgi:hypothetical protein